MAARQGTPRRKLHVCWPGAPDPFLVIVPASATVAELRAAIERAHAKIEGDGDGEGRQQDATVRHVKNSAGVLLLDEYAIEDVFDGDGETVSVVLAGKRAPVQGESPPRKAKRRRVAEPAPEPAAEPRQEDDAARAEQMMRRALKQIRKQKRKMKRVREELRAEPEASNEQAVEEAVEPEPVYEPEPEPVEESEPEPIEEPESTDEREPTEEPVPAKEQVEEPKPVPEPEPVDEPQPDEEPNDEAEEPEQADSDSDDEPAAPLLSQIKLALPKPYQTGGANLSELFVPGGIAHKAPPPATAAPVRVNGHSTAAAASSSDSDSDSDDDDNSGHGKRKRGANALAMLAADAPTRSTVAAPSRVPVPLIALPPGLRTAKMPLAPLSPLSRMQLRAPAVAARPRRRPASPLLHDRRRNTPPAPPPSAADIPRLLSNDELFDDADEADEGSE